MRRRDVEAGSLFALATAVAILLVLSSGCAGGLPAAVQKTHEGLKAMSAEVEPRLAAECLRRAQVCRDSGIRRAEDCPALLACRLWKTRYAEGLTQVHQGLGRCRDIHETLTRAGVIK